MPATVRVFLDTQQWNYLVDPPPDGRGVDLVRLRSAISTRRIELVGSVPIMQEIILTAKQNPAKYHQMMNLFAEMVGPRVVWPLDERVPREIRHGGLLPMRRRYVTAKLRRSMYECATGGDLVKTIAEVHQERDVFKMLGDERRGTAVGALDGKQKPETDRTIATWIQDVDVRRWVENVVADGASRGLYSMPDVSDVSSLRFPSVWAFVTIELAQIAGRVEGRRIDPSDQADSRHVADRPYYDVLVTDDARLARAATRAPCGCKRVMTSQDFAHAFLSDTPRDGES